MLEANNSIRVEKPVAIALMVGLLFSCGMITWSLSTQLDQTVLAVIVLFVLSQIALVAPRLAIGITFVFLAILGDIRRLLFLYVGPVRYDVLLLVGPLVGGLLMSTGLFRGKLETRTKIGWWVMLLTLLMALEIFNPKQGGLTVGFGGAFFYIVPMLWFWVGQVYGTQRFLHTVIFNVVVPLGVAAGLLACYQFYVGFPEYQYVWLQSQTVSNYVIFGTYRPFGFFVSPPEFAIYCAIGSAALLSGLVIKRVKPSIIFAPFLVFCCFIQGSRSHLLANIAALAGLWGIQPQRGETRINFARLGIASAIMFGGLMVTALWLQDSEGDVKANPTISYQVSGILDPGKSSATSHIDLVVSGLMISATEPVGLGLGAASSAVGKLSDNSDAGFNTEIDFSNMFVALGPIGGFIYLAVMFRTIQTVINYVRKTSSVEGLAVLGILICAAGHWLNGGHYAVTTLLWFCVGTVDRLELNRQNELVLA